MTAIGVVDLGIGNMGSILGAVSALGFDPAPVRAPEDVAKSGHLLLPGVGSFARGMAAIDAAGLRQPIRRHVEAGRPLMGICLGMQLLFEQGSEAGEAEGLGVLPGQIMRLDPPDPLPWPHVGWNALRVTKSHPLMKGLRDGVDFYFVHGYRADCPADIVVAECDYGQTFPAVAARGPVFGVQFHAEKSQRSGLRIIENFCAWSP